MSGLWALKRKKKKDRKEEGGDGNKERFLIGKEKAAEFTEKSPTVKCGSQRRGVKINGSDTFSA